MHISQEGITLIKHYEGCPKDKDGKVVSYTDASDSINKLREAISKISNSNILSDDQKEKNIDIARERTRQKIIEMGLDPDKFSF